MSAKLIVSGNDERAYGLLLGGAGTMSLAHVGVLKALQESGIAIREITGASVGAVIAALYANALSSSQIEMVVRESAGFWLAVSVDCDAPSYRRIVDLVPGARRFVSKHQLQPRASLRVVACDLRSNTLKVFARENYHLAEALAAACSVPGIARPVRMDGMLLADASIIDRTPACGGCVRSTIVSRVCAACETPEGLRTHADALSVLREQLIPSRTLTSDALSAELLIDIPSPAVAADGSCALSQEVLTAVFTSGYEAAKSALERHLGQTGTRER